MPTRQPHEEKRIVIAGAGPAGLTAAYELLHRGVARDVTVHEASGELGGISRTVRHNGNRIDIGGHRFFSKSDRVTDWWLRLLPVQSAPALDERLLGERMTSGKIEVPAGAGADPEHTDRVMLIRRRVSRIYYLRRFFDYPISLSMATLRGMGLKRTLEAAAGYLAACVRRRPEKSLEDFYINRFGKPLYRMFFEGYTGKVWGLHPSRLGADWGSQRVKGLSVIAILKDIATKSLGVRRKVETSLIEEFLYPKFGPGQLWETAGAEVEAMGGRICLGSTVEEVHLREGRVDSVTVRRADGSTATEKCDCFISSMPVKELVAALRGVEIPEEALRTAAELPYRDFITVGLLVDRLALDNRTRLRTYADRIPDTWIYVQERDVRLGRVQIFNNWSPYMPAYFEGKIWLGLEYFCFEGDDLWNRSDADMTALAAEELRKTGIIGPDTDICDSVCIRVKKAYPAYHGSYYRLDCVRRFLDSIPNLYCVGRNGQHRYNNMDHSMLTAMEAVDAIAAGSTDKSAIWNVNTESDYHEKQSNGNQEGK